MKNKYFWIFNISNIVAFGRLLIFSATNYVCLYILGGQLGADMRGVMVTVASVGYVVPACCSLRLFKEAWQKEYDVAVFRRLDGHFRTSFDIV